MYDSKKIGDIMKKIILGLITAIVFFGCSSDNVDTKNIKPALVIEQSLSSLTLKDQFEKSHEIDADTKRVIFAFSKDMAHTCNDYFVTKDPTYLADNNTQFVADVSAAPSIIRSMFILPGLKDFKHTVLLLDDKKIAAPYRKNIDTEKIIVVSLNNKVITKIESINSVDELKNIIK